MKNKSAEEIYGDIELAESHEELKADLGGYLGDFHRHRVDKSIKKRTNLTEKEFINMLVHNNRLKDITLAIRSIDPERNGYVT